MVPRARSVEGATRAVPDAAVSGVATRQGSGAAARRRTRTRILIACDVRLYRDGLTFVIADRPACTIVGTASDRDEAVGAAIRLKPDVVLLDMAMADALTTAGELGEQVPDARVVALTVPDTERSVLECAQAGVAGYVTRNGSVEDLIEAVETAARGDAAYPPRMVAALVRRVAEAERAAAPPPPERCLTPRERDVAGLLVDGLSNKEIASRLFIEVPTVKNHVHNILEKLSVSRRGEAVARLSARHRAQSA
jgi:two-component system, NarL family, nitrate/nitrite response regulator NarL